jgi:hypothetical protein
VAEIEAKALRGPALAAGKAGHRFRLYEPVGRWHGKKGRSVNRGRVL